MANVDVDLDILNGDNWVGPKEGETLEAREANIIFIPHGMQTANAPLQTLEITQEQMRAFMRLNIRHLMHLRGAFQPPLSDNQICILAYLKLLVVKNGLASRHFDPAAYHVDYTEVVGEDHLGHDVEDLPEGFRLVDHLSAANQRLISESFADRVCLTAFVFRGRGHHYLDSYEELYGRVWEKCRWAPNVLQIPFKYQATIGLHAIYPMILDQFWKHCVDESLCNGALIKRFDVAPAGIAGPKVLAAGLEDIQMVAPGLKERLREAIDYLEGVIAQTREHRFAGSVNARYYGAPRIRVEEQKLSAIAATIKASVDGLAEDAPIARSAALQRIARGAPVTGAVLSRAIGRIAEREEVVNSLLIAPE